MTPQFARITINASNSFSKIQFFINANINENTSIHIPTFTKELGGIFEVKIRIIITTQEVITSDERIRYINDFF